MYHIVFALLLALSVMAAVHGQEPGPVIISIPTDAPLSVPTESPVLKPTKLPVLKPTKAPVFHTHHPSEVPTPVPTEVHKHFYGFTMLVFMIVIVAIIAYFTRRSPPPSNDDDDDVDGGVAMGQVGSSTGESTFKGGYHSLATDNKA